MLLIKKIFPIGDQALTAAYNFLFVFLTSLILDERFFIEINYLFLFLMFMLNIHNALVFQPLMKEISVNKIIPKSLIYFILRHLLKLNILGIIILTVMSTLYKIEYLTILLTYIWLVFIVVYEISKRLLMVFNKWNINFYLGIVLNSITWPIILVLQPSTSIEYLILVLLPLFLVTCLIVLKLKLTLIGKIEDVCTNKLDFSYLKKGGFILLGGAISFWFISGGYLMFIGGYISLSDSANLRIIQNLFNGVLIILTVLDNYILSGNGKKIVSFSNRINILMIVVVPLYSLLVYIVILLFYPDNFELQSILPIWSLIYILLGLSRIKISIIKFYKFSKSIFYSQLFGVLLYLLMAILYLLFNSANIDAKNASIIWLPCLLLINLLIVNDLKKVKIYSVREKIKV